MNRFTAYLGIVAITGITLLGVISNVTSAIVDTHNIDCGKNELRISNSDSEYCVDIEDLNIGN